MKKVPHASAAKVLLPQKSTSCQENCAAKVANHEYDFVEKMDKEDLALAKLILKSYVYTFLEKVQF